MSLTGSCFSSESAPRPLAKRSMTSQPAPALCKSASAKRLSTSTGRAIAEVGAIIIVGGNMRGYTRMLTGDRISSPALATPNTSL